MPGYKQWADGDVLLPSELDEYIVGQTIMRFANATARTAAFPSPVEGMRSYLTDTKLEYIYANGAWAYLMAFFKKSATQSVTNSTTYVDDVTFQATVPVGTYVADLYGSASGPSGADFKCRWAFSGTLGSTGRFEYGPGLNTTHAPATAAAATTVGVTRATVDLYTADGRYGTDGSNPSAIHEHFYLEVSASGLLKFQWAQDNANASPTNLASTSHMILQRLA